jgi:nitroreductase
MTAPASSAITTWVRRPTPSWLAAADLGVGSGHSSVGDQEKAREILGVPADHDVAFLIGLGYPADRPLRPLVKPNRRPFDEVVRRGHW